MISSLPLCCLAFVLTQDVTVPTRFAQVVPSVPAGQIPRRSPGKTRAVVVIQGYTLHLTKTADASIKWHSYQKPDSPLVKLISQDADVFALAYGQTLPVSSYSGVPVFRQDIQFLQRLGYQEIVLVGFSAGGLIARQFVEDLPNSGVTKVIQVDSPNLGTEWAVGSWEPLRHSLTYKVRREFFQKRQGLRIPDSVQFACVVGTGLIDSDGVVSIRSQWPEDLQEQGIPAYTLRTTHLTAARSQTGIQLIAKLVQEPLIRWDALHVAAMRRQLREPAHP